MKLTSQAFNPGETIPRRYTGDGEDISPPMEWTELPEGAGALALLCEDPDAPREEPWVHWLIYDMPATLAHLPEGVAPKPEISDPAKCRQGCNTFEKIGYGGPAPPRGHGPHHYIFTLYALRGATGLKAAATKAQFLKAIEGHALATAGLTGIYERK